LGKKFFEGGGKNGGQRGERNTMGDPDIATRKKEVKMHLLRLTRKSKAMMGGNYVPGWGMEQKNQQTGRR